MHVLNRLTAGTIAVLTVLLISIQKVDAAPAKAPAGIAAFVDCSRQCVAEQQQCHKKLVNKCKYAGLDCFEPCDVAYPGCMAKCPKPGSQG